MIRFNTSSPIYPLIGLGLLIGELCLFVIGLPPFHTGSWVQIEPVLMVFFAFGYLTTAWLALGLAKDWIIIERVSLLWWVMALWVGWQTILLPTAERPWSSWFGAPEDGEGVAWHIILLAMTMLAMPLLQVRRYRHILFTIAITCLMIETALHVKNALEEAAGGLRPEIDRWIPTPYSKHLAFIAGYIWIILSCWVRFPSRYWRFGLAGTVAAILYLSENRTGILFLGSAVAAEILAILFGRYRKLRRYFIPNTSWRIALSLACILPLIAWVTLSLNIADIEKYSEQPDSLLQQLDIHPNFSLFDKEGSVGSRPPYIQVVGEVLRHEPLVFLKGQGWGRYSEDLHRYALVDGVYAYHDGAHRPNWTALSGFSAAHSHCQPLEALLSMGIVGIALWFAIPLLVIWQAPRWLFWRVVPAVSALTLLSCFWFEIAQDIAYRAMALATLCLVLPTRDPHSIALPKTIRSLSVPFLIASCFALGWTTWQQHKLIEYTQRIHYATLSVTSDQFPVEYLTEDIARGGNKLRDNALTYTESMMKGLRKGKPFFDPWAGWYTLFLHAMHEYSLSSISTPRGCYGELWMAYKLFSDLAVPQLKPIKNEVALQLPQMILLNTRKAPERDDVAASFLNMLPRFLDYNRGKQIAYLHELLAIAPNHRGALWVLGKLLKEEPETEAEGIALMRRSVAMGLEKVFPVTEEELKPYR